MLFHLDELDIHTLRFGEESSSAKVFERLYNGYVRVLINYGLNRRLPMQEAEDVAVETLMELWKKRGRMESADHIRRFLYYVAQNRIINLNRKTQVIKRFFLWKEYTDGPAGVAENVQQDIGETDDVEIALAEIMDCLQKGIASDMAQSLPEKCRKVFILKYVEEQPVEQIAASLGIKVKTVYAQCHRARTLLRKMFGNPQLLILPLCCLIFLKKQAASCRNFELPRVTVYSERSIT